MVDRIIYRCGLHSWIIYAVVSTGEKKVRERGREEGEEKGGRGGGWGEDKVRRDCMVNRIICRCDLHSLIICAVVSTGESKVRERRQEGRRGTGV